MRMSGSNQNRESLTFTDRNTEIAAEKLVK